MPNKSMVVKIDNEAARILNDISGKSNLSKSYIVSEMIKSAHPQTEYEQNIQAERAYDWVLNFIAMNSNKFQGNEMTECWGKIDDEYIYINKNVLTSQMSANGFEFDAMKTKWAEKGYLIKNSQKRLVHNTRCYGIKGMYIKLLQKTDEETKIPEEVPF